MTKDIAAVKEKIQPELFIAPHVGDIVILLVLGEWQPDDYQYKQLIEHLSECKLCRANLSVFLMSIQQVEGLDTSSEVELNTLRLELANISQKIESQEYERMGRYAETIIFEGEKAAEEQFPTFTEHLKNCTDCKIALEETLEFLRKTQDTY